MNDEVLFRNNILEISTSSHKPVVHALETTSEFRARLRAPSRMCTATM